MELFSSLFGMAPLYFAYSVQFTKGHPSVFLNIQEYYASFPIPYFNFFVYGECGQAFSFSNYKLILNNFFKCCINRSTLS